MEKESNSAVLVGKERNGINRFSGRVENYVKYRPHYPADVVSFLKDEGLLTNDTVVADIGSGTGLSAVLFLKEGNVVYGVEPNREMRHAAQKILTRYKNFCSINGTAENTNLPTDDIDLIVSAQAFHWFDIQKCKLEFQRILKTDGVVVLMWNDRRTESTEFLKAYEHFITEFATDYSIVNHKNLDESIFNNFFGQPNYKMKSFLNAQHFDYERLKGLILSTSFMPEEGEKNFEEMMIALKNIFDRFAVNGKVTIEYDTKIHYGRLH